MKKLFLIALFTISLLACKKEEIDYNTPEERNKNILGNWMMYCEGKTLDDFDYTTCIEYPELTKGFINFRVDQQFLSVPELIIIDGCEFWHYWFNFYAVQNLSDCCWNFIDANTLIMDCNGKKVRWVKY